nr:hypothetical protein [uncultured Desulfobulbus sp.]
MITGIARLQCALVAPEPMENFLATLSDSMSLGRTGLLTDSGGDI